MRRSGGIRQRVHPQWLRQRGQNSTQTTVLKDGYSPRWLGRLLISMDKARRTPSSGSSRQRQSRKAPEADEFGILEDDRCIDTGIFQRRYLVHEFVFACSPLPPPRPQLSHTILTQAKPTGVPFAQWPDAGSSQSSRPWSRDPKCFGTDRSL